MDIRRPRLVIPLEIVEEILFRLPVKSLIRLRCVSKAWRGLINDSVFIERHLVHSRNNHPGIIIDSNYYQYQKRLYILCQSWCPDGTMDPEHYFRTIQCSDYDRMYALNHHSSSSRDEAQRNNCAVCVLGCCDGLLFLASYPLKSIFLWWLYNPSTRKYRRLPIPVTVIPSEASNQDEIYGFGYNATLKDYQIIRVMRFFCKTSNTFHFIGEVYSLKNTSWRQIQVPLTIQPKIFCGFVGVFVNDAVHWVIKHDSSANLYGIIAFNFVNDEFFVLPLPDFGNSESCNSLQVVVVGGCFCLICVYENYFEGWMMRDYGVKESWTKFFEVTGEAPRCSLKQGEELLFEAHNVFAHSNNLHYYKSEDASVVRLPIPLPLYPGSVCFAASYVESLVPLG